MVVDEIVGPPMTYIEAVTKIMGHDLTLSNGSVMKWVGPGDDWRLKPLARGHWATMDLLGNKGPVRLFPPEGATRMFVIFHDDLMLEDRSIFLAHVLPKLQSWIAKNREDHEREMRRGS